MSISLERALAWTRSPARARHVYVVAALVGVAAYLAVYGAGSLIGTNAYWEMPGPDERMALMGYRYFLYDSWHWPIFINHSVNVPYPKSVAFLDCIPIWALVNKVLATMIPPWRSFSANAYLGLWHALAYALQACFGVAILRALGHRSWRAGIVSALFFIAVPTWICRYGHPALSAHWIVLWALYLYLRTPARCPSRCLAAAQLCQLAVASLVSPYHAVISLGLFLASLVRSRTLRTAAVYLPLGLFGVAAMNWVVGYLSRESAIPQWGFQHESANLMSWLIPVRSGIIGDAQWIMNVTGTPWQYEGYSYLGFGVLGLLALFVPHARQLGDVISRHRVLFILVVGSCLFALSNHIYFGTHEIFSYPIPRILRWIPNQFRSPGRFVWLPTYVVITYLLHWALTCFSSDRRFIIVVLAAVLQVVDARGDWSLQRSMTTGPQYAMLDRGAWRSLVDAHDAVVILPPYSCVFDDDAPRLDLVSMEIQMLASERALPINGTYSARAMRQCANEAQEWPTLAPQPGTLYVLLPPAVAVADRMAARGVSCATFDYGRVCSRNTAAITAALRTNALRPPPDPIALRYGDKLQLAAVATLNTGWTAPEMGGRWTATNVASVLLRLDGNPGEKLSLKLQAQAKLCGKREIQDVDVLLDERTLTTLHFDARSNDPTNVRVIEISDQDHVRGNVVAVQFRPHDNRAPASLGCGDDSRKLGLWVSQLWFE